MGPLVGDVGRGGTQLSLFTQVTLNKSPSSRIPVPASEQEDIMLLSWVVQVGSLVGRGPPPAYSSVAPEIPLLGRAGCQDLSQDRRKASQGQERM